MKTIELDAMERILDSGQHYEHEGLFVLEEYRNSVCENLFHGDRLCYFVDYSTNNLLIFCPFYRGDDLPAIEDYCTIKCKVKCSCSTCAAELVRHDEDFLGLRSFTRSLEATIRQSINPDAITLQQLPREREIGNGVVQEYEGSESYQYDERDEYVEILEN
jgi:hypothetical protein